MQAQPQSCEVPSNPAAVRVPCSQDPSVAQASLSGQDKGWQWPGALGWGWGPIPHTALLVTGAAAVLLVPCSHVGQHLLDQAIMVHVHLLAVLCP